jgi:cysteine-rich repeat protein
MKTDLCANRVIAGAVTFALMLLAARAASAVFVDGVERFDGTVKNVATWVEYLGPDGPPAIVQDDDLTIVSPDTSSDYMTTFTVGVGDVVSVTLLGATSLGWTGLYLTNDSEGTSAATLWDSHFLFLQYSPADQYFVGGDGGAGGTGGYAFAMGSPLPTPAAPYVLQIERTSSTEATYRVFDGSMTLIDSRTWTFADVPDELFVTLVSEFNTPVFDDVVAPAPPICGDGLPAPGEQCDDGNLDDGDCCSSTCQWDTKNLECSDDVSVDPGAPVVISLFGGSGVPGGADLIFTAVTAGGTLHAVSSSLSDPAEIQAIYGAFNFQLPTVPAQAWFIDFDGSFAGAVTLVFGYDENDLAPGFTESDLRMYHRLDGWWSIAAPVEPPPWGIDTAADTITISVEEFSPFALGGQAVPEHFMFYKSRPTRLAPKFYPFGPVRLEDQFGATSYDVVKPVQLGLPADKNGEGVVDAATHLAEYKLRLPRGAVRFEAVDDVRVVNQCTDLVLQIKKPVSLLVPAAKSLTDPGVGVPEESQHNLDHFLCYRARVQRRLSDGTPVAGLPKGIQVRVTDQFDDPDRIYDLGKVTKLCVPVAKSEDPAGEPVLLAGPAEGDPVPIERARIRNPGQHLVCYRAKLARRLIAQSGCGPLVPGDRGTPIVPRQAAHAGVSGMYVNDQLGPIQLDSKREAEFCIPSAKLLPAP